MIGVNAAIASESGGFEGIGFTIPSNIALHVAKALIAHGKEERGWLGVSVQDLTPELSKSVHAETTKGALIAEVARTPIGQEAKGHPSSRRQERGTDRQNRESRRGDKSLGGFG